VTSYDFLLAQPETNTQQMLVVGHSEGGMYALLEDLDGLRARQSSDPGVPGGGTF
jgi:hypothetical protein